jgi:hypothetical protein
MPVTLIAVNTADLVREAVQVQAALAHSKRIQLECDLPHGRRR